MINNFAQGFVKNFASGFVSGGGSSAPLAPFPYITDRTYWFKAASASITIDVLGDDTFAVIPNLLGDGELIQQTKDYQLLYDASGFKGLHLDQRSNAWAAGSVVGFNNNPDAVYIACNLRVDTITSEFIIFNNGRFSLRVPTNRQVGFTHPYVEGGDSWAFRAPAITLGAWYTVEMYFDYTTDLCTFWYNGVAQTLAFDALKTYAPTATDKAATIDAGDGVMPELIYVDIQYGGSLTDAAAFETLYRTGISTYINGERP